MDSPAKRLQWAREHRTKFKTPTEAARSYGWKVSTYLGHENGDRNPSREAAKRYARAYRVRWEWILEGQGKPAAVFEVPLVGKVGAGSIIAPFDDNPQGQGIGEVDLPPGAPSDVVAVVVEGNSMYPRYFGGERLFYARHAASPEEAIGRECVVKLRDGTVLVKTVRKGTRKGRYTLESLNAPPLEDQALEWAAPVRWTERP
jgi:phage repressor protein C with HTH and peptisase S24 domain